MNNPETLATFGYTRHRTKTKSRMNNPETLATFGYTRHRTKTNKTNKQQRKIKR